MRPPASAVGCSGRSTEISPPATTASTTPTSAALAGFSPDASPHTTGMTEPTAAAIGATTPARPTASPW